MRRCHHRRQFPVAEMRREAQCWFPVVLQLDEHRLIVGYDTAGVRMRRVVVPQAAEMHVFACDPTEIVPRTAQRRSHPCRVLLRERGAKIGAADTMRRGQRAQSPRHRAAPIRGAIGIRTPERCKRVLDQAAKQPVSVEREVAARLKARQGASRTRRGFPAARDRHGSPPADKPCRSPDARRWRYGPTRVQVRSAANRMSR